MATMARVEAPLGRSHGASIAPRTLSPSRPSDQQRSLSSLIESEIIPRLMLAHAAPAVVDPPHRGVRIEADDVAALAPLALNVDAAVLLAHVDALLARGISVEAVMVDLLAPTARLLGEWWEDDRCTFVDVTMGLWRLQEVVHEIAARAPAERRRVAGGRRALFAAMPGDDHDFGTVVLDELFRREGWVTDRLSGAETPALLSRVSGSWFDLVGLTVSCDCHIGPLPSVVAALRNVSRNPRLCVMVGGRVLVADPDLAARVGADGTASDARLALQMAADLVRACEEARLVA